MIHLVTPSGDRPKTVSSTRCKYECFLPCKICPELLHSPRDDEDICKSGDTGTRSSYSPRQRALYVYVQRTSGKVPFVGIVFSENRKRIIRYISSRFFVMKQINYAFQCFAMLVLRISTYARVTQFLRGHIQLLLTLCGEQENRYL